MFQPPRLNKANELSPGFYLFFPQEHYSFLKHKQQEFALWACLWSVARRQDGQSSRADTSNPGYLAAPLYFSAAPTVRTAGRGMSGLSKTHGFANPTRLNVNSWVRRRRAARLFERCRKLPSKLSGRAIEKSADTLRYMFLG